uniref:Site-2 protease family protein n=1 Tax=Eiseniibacteriota bacterium TaxID=2212470 RepID=A0A832HZM4_UNCEI
MRLDPEVVFVAPVLVLSAVLHECAHGLAALRLGDSTARDEGRLTLDPFRHADAIGMALVPAVLLLFQAPCVIGWARPAPVDRARLRRPVRDHLAVALAGPAANLLLALAFGLLARLAPGEGPLSALRAAGLAGVAVNAALVVFHLLPIPPLDGSWVLMRFLPMRHIIALHHFRIAGLALVALLVASPVAGGVALAPVRLVARGVLALWGVPAAEAGL